MPITVDILGRLNTEASAPSARAVDSCWRDVTDTRDHVTLLFAGYTQLIINILIYMSIYLSHDTHTRLVLWQYLIYEAYYLIYVGF